MLAGEVCLTTSCSVLVTFQCTSSLIESYFIIQEKLNVVLSALSKKHKLYYFENVHGLVMRSNVTISLSLLEIIDSVELSNLQGRHFTCTTQYRYLSCQ